ncbi:MAG: protein kinase domain-containing protein [Planktothrix sp.]
MANIKRQALVVGINRYSFLRDTATGLLLNLKKPASDAEAIAQLLENPTGELAWSVQRLPEVSEGGRFRIGDTATVSQDELTKAIQSLFQPEPQYATEGALLFFAGHGLRRQHDDQTEGFLATSDSNGKSKWGVSLTWLREVLLNSPVKQQIVWLDCCHSGELLNFLSPEELHGWLSGGDRLLVAACRGDREAYALGKHGVLTEVLLKGLDPQNYPSGEWISSWNLMEFIEKQLNSNWLLKRQIPLLRQFGEKIKLWEGQKPLLIGITNEPQHKVSILNFKFNEVIENPSLLHGAILEAYLLKKFVGLGGSGIVYQAIDLKIGKLCAIKLFYPIKNELIYLTSTVFRIVRALASLSHPNIIKIFDIESFYFGERVSFYIVMECLQGSSLVDFSYSSSISEKLNLSLAIANALKFIHNYKYIDEIGIEQTGILHGDIKPTNIMVLPDKSPVIIDFMMVDVQRLLDLKVIPYHLQRGFIPMTAAFGTPGFMSPEQEEQGIITVKTDVYSLGVTFLSLFFPEEFDSYPFLKLPFLYKPIILDEFFRNQLTKKENLIQQKLKILIEEMLNKDPKLRPAMESVAQDLSTTFEQNNLFLNNKNINLKTIDKTPFQHLLNCIKCNALLQSHLRFCEKCGNPISRLNCSNCNALLKTGVKFCEKCGKPVNR